MSAILTSFFNKVKTLVWPVNKGERRKFALMIAMFFLISFNYNILRAVKESLLVTAVDSGAEALPFIKLWVILPMALLMTFFFTKLSNKYSLEKIFYIIIFMFVGFFIFFTLFLYPYKEALQPLGFVSFLGNHLPAGFKGFLAIIRHWPLSLFYVMSELWGTMILSVLFWGIANEVTSVNQAKRFYVLFGLGANVGGALAGQASIFLSKITFASYIPYGKVAWDQSILYINITLVLVAFLIMMLFKMLVKKSIGKNATMRLRPKKNNKQKQSLRKTFSYLSKSKYILCIAVIVLTYNIAINLVEVVWKNQVNLLYPNPADYNAYMGEVMSLMGVIATIVSLFISGSLLRKFSWSFNALIPVGIMTITGIGFFSFLLNGSALAGIAALLGSTPLLMSVFFGTMHNCLVRASKYTIFDSTKEMAFIPLDTQSKLKGKAAIDGVGSRLGKSTGSVIHQTLILAFGSIAASTPYIAIIFVAIIGIWYVAVISLGKQFNVLLGRKEKEQEDAPQDELQKLSDTEAILSKKIPANAHEKQPL
jgi:ATP:ADP antiporter, AAA family